jgi:ferredoxin--NADP+ reductase
MFKILHKQIYGENIKRLDVLAEPIARRVQPGQFVIVVPVAGGEWIPLTIAESDTRRGTVTLIFREEGAATQQLGAIPINENIFSIIGPFGNPALIEKVGLVVCVATGVGIASMLPVCRALKDIGNKVIGVVGGKTRRTIMLETQMRLACSKLFIATEDGSYERRGMASAVVKHLLEEGGVERVYAVGSLEMMQAVCQLTKEKKVKTRVQIHSNILCGTGVCGACRTRVGGETVLACQHGPEFDGHRVDFEILKMRLRTAQSSQTKPGAAFMRPKDKADQAIAKFFPGRLSS